MMTGESIGNRPRFATLLASLNATLYALFAEKTLHLVPLLTPDGAPFP